VLYDAAALGDFWNWAETRTPLVIVGGGRWARVWANVVSQARESADDIVMVTRNDPADLRDWLASREALHAIRVAGSVEQAFALIPAQAAIVASHPRDHVADALAALDRGAHVMVEKPLSDIATSARALATAAGAADRVLAIGTEFAFLPALHQCARLLGPIAQRGLEMRLRWDDPSGEVRHGAIKMRHKDIPLLADLMPHALSIFGIFDDGPLHLVNAHHDHDASTGRLILTGNSSGRYELLSNAQSDRRRRVLEIASAHKAARVDFSEELPTIVVDGVRHPIDPDLVRLTSTLRLELGAFMKDISFGRPGTPITARVPDQIRLGEDLSLACKSPGKGH
jgi:predicted dehydrogenase